MKLVLIKSVQLKRSSEDKKKLMTNKYSWGDRDIQSQATVVSFQQTNTSKNPREREEEKKLWEHFMDKKINGIFPKNGVIYFFKRLIVNAHRFSIYFARFRSIDVANTYIYKHNKSIWWINIMWNGSKSFRK